MGELVGDAILWLRKPGLNIFKWSTNSTYRRSRTKLHVLPKAFNDGEFYFSGYIVGNDKMRQLLNDCPSLQCYQDLDWCFVVFLLLGLVPTAQSSYFRYYFNQKLLSALPGYVPFATLLR